MSVPAKTSVERVLYACCTSTCSGYSKAPAVTLMNSTACCGGCIDVSAGEVEVLALQRFIVC